MGTTPRTAPRRGRGRGRRVVAAVALCAPVLTVGTTAVHASDATELPNASYSATAEAWGVRARISNPQLIPLGLSAEPGGPFVRAELDSLGGSTGMASLPYPGDDLVGVPNLVGSAVPQLGFIPAYPLLVLSDSTTQPTAEKSSPAYTLKAASSGTASSALAQGGVLPQLIPVGSSTATSDVSVTDTGVTSKAGSVTQAFGLSGVLELGTVRASATARRDTLGKLKRSSDLLFGLTIAGVPIGLGNGQLVTGGLSPGRPIDEVPALQAALAQAGIEDVSFEKPVLLPNGIRSAGLRIVQRLDLPGAPPAVAIPCLPPVPEAPCGPILASTFRITYQLGSVEATANLRPYPTFPSSSGTTGNVATPGGFTTQSGPLAGSVDSTSGTGVPTLAGAPQVKAPAVDAGSVLPASGAPQLSLARALTDSINIYLVLVVLGLLMTASAQLLRRQGVRTSWT